MLDDGVYGLCFETRASGGFETEPDRGEGLAVLRGGQILGSDSNGGIFRGSYRYDAGRGETQVDVRLAIPPHGILLTGFSAGPEGALVDVSGWFRRPRPVSSSVIDIAGAPIVVQLRYVGPLAG